MHVLLHILLIASSWLDSIVVAVEPAPSSLTGCAPGRVGFLLATAFVSSLTTIAGCAFWIAGERVRFYASRRLMQATITKDQGALALRDAMLSAGRDAIVVLGADANALLSFSGGGTLIRSCLAGPDAHMLARAIDALVRNGTAFSLNARTPDHSLLLLRGRVVVHTAVVYLTTEATAEDYRQHYQTMMGSLPVPVWICDGALEPCWANAAFLAADPGKAPASNTLFISSKDALENVMGDSDGVTLIKHVPLGKFAQKEVAFAVWPLPGAVAGMAIDIAEGGWAVGKLSIEIVDELNTAIAIFGQDHVLLFGNSAYQVLWKQPERPPSACQHWDEIFEFWQRCCLPPQPSGSPSSMKMWLRYFGNAGVHVDEVWHLADGRGIRVVATGLRQGGLCVEFYEVSDRLCLERSYNCLLDTHKAILDALTAGVAIFASDGRLTAYNQAFATQWHLTKADLSGEPHLKDIESACASSAGRDDIWKIVALGIRSAQPELYNDWACLVRSDGKIFSLSLTRLPNGTTLVIFCDLASQVRSGSTVHESFIDAAWASEPPSRIAFERKPTRDEHSDCQWTSRS